MKGMETPENITLLLNNMSEGLPHQFRADSVYFMGKYEQLEDETNMVLEELPEGFQEFFLRAPGVPIQGHEVEAMALR